MVLVLAVVGALVLAMGLREVRLLAPRRRRVLGAVRSVTVLLGLALAAQPRCTGERVRIDPGRLAVLADTSRSMSIASGEETRESKAKRALDLWSSSPAAPTTSAHSFGRQIERSSLARLANDYPTSEDATRIGAAISDVLAADRRGELGAVLVVSDGADTEGLRIEDVVAKKVRVHALAIGGGDTLRDDAIASAHADPVAFLRQEAEVRVVVRSLGRAGGRIPVTLRRGDQVVRELQVDVPADGEAEVVLKFTPERLGRAVYRVSIPVAADDAVPENNERAFLVRVTRDKLRVLLVAGRPSWDVRFLRSFLKRDPATDLISFFILRTSSDLTMASPEELALIPFPTDELFREHLGSFDVVFFQNFEYGPYGMAPYLPRIREYVLRGGSFVMIGGDQSFGSGGYQETDLGPILPVTMPPRGTAESRLVVTGRFQPQLASGFARHPLLELLPEPAANLGAWQALAPLEGVNVITGLAGDGQALLTHPTQRTASGDPMPVLAIGTAGRGRVLTFATDTSYRWGITTGGRIGDGSAFERFWDRALRWLSRDPALEPAQITTDRERYGPSANVLVDALLRDARYEPIVDRDVRLAILDAAGIEVAAVDVRTDAQGRAGTKLTAPSAPGAYRTIARLPESPEPLAEESFLIETGGDELSDPRPRPALLRALAEATGGTFVAFDGRVPDLESFDASRTRSLGTVSLEPLSTPWALALLGLAFLAEWALRRRWGRR